MDFDQLRNSLLLFHRNLLEKAERSSDPDLREAYLTAARHLKDVASHLYKFDQAMKRVKDLERTKGQPN